MSYNVCDGARDGHDTTTTPQTQLMSIKSASTCTRKYVRMCFGIQVHDAHAIKADGIGFARVCVCVSV